MPCSIDLRQRIEDLALRLVMGGSDADCQAQEQWIADLEAIRQSASAEGASTVAEAADAAIGKIRGAVGSALSGADLEKEIGLLQQAIETGDRPCSSSNQQISQDRELLSDFILESREHLTVIESNLLTLERDPADDEALH